MTHERIRELLAQPHQFASWLKGLPEDRRFAPADDCDCPTVRFVQEVLGIADFSLIEDGICYCEGYEHPIKLDGWIIPFTAEFDRFDDPQSPATALAVLERVCPEVA